WEAAPGPALPEMERVTALVSKELQAVPGVLDVGAHVGRAVTSDQSANVNSGEIWVSLDPAAAYQSTVSAVRDVVNGYPGINNEVMTYPEERLREVLGGQADAMVVRLYGQDFATLNTKPHTIHPLF